MEIMKTSQNKCCFPLSKKRGAGNDIICQCMHNPQCGLRDAGPGGGEMHGGSVSGAERPALVIPGSGDDYVINTGSSSLIRNSNLIAT